MSTPIAFAVFNQAVNTETGSATRGSHTATAGVDHVVSMAVADGFLAVTSRKSAVPILVPMARVVSLVPEAPKPVAPKPADADIGLNAAPAVVDQKPAKSGKARKKRAR